MSLKLNQEVSGNKANEAYYNMSQNGDMFSEVNSKVSGYKWHMYCESGEYLVQAVEKDRVTKIKRIK